MAKNILINLHSFQTIPNYVAIKEIAPDEVLALVTPEFADQVALFFETTKIKHQMVEIDAYKLEENFKVIKDLLDKVSVKDEIIINYTGGTKIMAVSLILQLLLSAKQKLSFVYINTFNNKLEYLYIKDKAELSTESVQINTIVPLDIYTKLKGEKIKSVENDLLVKVEQRVALSETLLLDPDVKGVFRIQSQFFEKIGKRTIQKTSFEKYTEKYDLKWDRQSLSLVTNNVNYEFDHNDGGVYFSGAWLEEYIFHKLKTQNTYDEVLASVKFDFTSISDKRNNNKIFKNEIDVVISKGLKTVFIECKAGYVSQDYVYKLKVIRDHFLGTFGEAVLVTKFPQKENIIEKCKDANIILVSGEEIEQINNIINQIIK